ncbi:PGF-CTERM sorting domain-containing protein [Methanohalobium sp.]|uniref:PGF-CTERM sorting domain-containing protein n=1 Tax=Methanohalobium sp. TaxID=2837493 RepID=UPI0025EA2BC1|nr:PGF-CTERM sorting domain-containing protein [Methanohalobium sp.]
MNKFNKLGMILVSTLLVFALSMPVSAHEGHSHDDAPQSLVEVEEHANEIISVAETIHTESAKIADDKSLNSDLRAKAETVHKSSHEIEHIAKEIISNVETLEGIEHPDENKDKVKTEISEINENIDELANLLNSKSDAVHEVEENTPQSHKEYAEDIHHEFHELGEIGSHLKEHASEIENDMIETGEEHDHEHEEGSSSESESSSKSSESEQEGAVESPGFGSLLAISGLFAVVYLVKRK